MTTVISLDENHQIGNPQSQLDGIGNDVRYETPNSCFFGYLDILGFKNIVKRNSFNQLKSIVEDFTLKCAAAIDKSRCIGSTRIKLSESSAVGKSCVHARIVSDSIYVWTENDDRLKRFDDLLQIINALIVSGFQQGLPLRGVVTFGELFLGSVKIPKDIPLDFSFDNGSAYGRALVEAYELESQLDWSGVLLTPRAWAKVAGEFEISSKSKKSAIMRSGNIKSATDLFNHFPHLLWYNLPFKGGIKRNAIAFNWNYKPCFELSAEKIRKAFIERCDVVNDAIMVKLNETIRFYEYSQRVSELCDFGLKKELPVPDSDYVLSTLGNA